MTKEELIEIRKKVEVAALILQFSGATNTYGLSVEEMVELSAGYKVKKDTYNWLQEQYQKALAEYLYKDPKE